MMLTVLLLVCLLLVVRVHAEDIFVSNSYTNSSCSVSVRECPDVASALRISSSFDSIFVQAGEYNGTQNANLCIASCTGLKGITLAGLGDPSEVVFNSLGTDFADSIAMFIYENTITSISNITFAGFSNPSAQEPNKVGAIEIVDSEVTFHHVIFRNNTGVFGGAMHAKNSNVTLNSTHFDKNAAKLHGGAVMFVNSNGFIDKCSFTGNNVTSDPADIAGTGGAIYSIGVNDLTIVNSKFINNGAQISGGAVFMDLNSNSAAKTDRGTFSARDTTFSGNSVNGLGSCVSSGACNSRGGALYLSVLSTNLQGCTFDGNGVQTTSTTTAAQGGGVYVTTNALDIYSPFVGIYVFNCTFSGNHATGQGGALYVTGQRLNLLSSTLTKNYVSTPNTYFTDSASQGGAVYYTTGNLGDVASNVLDCLFEDNSAYSGWGGAIFGTDSGGKVYVQRTIFRGNNAYSSYTNTGHGGAMMVASNFDLNLYDCKFTNNSALPYLQLVPLTYSGSGGALFAQTTAVNVTNCDFDGNLALTGQFDSGSAGGAIMLEDCFPAFVVFSTFNNNGAAGYYGYSSFASPGTGGAVYVKFSAAKLTHNTFTRNWVSAGGDEASIGGAVAVFFEYSSVAKSMEGVTISHCLFEDNAAYGEICTIPNQSGQGGALAVVGASVPAVYVSHSNFTSNLALTASKTTKKRLKGESLSLGGALSIALSSNVTMIRNVFETNQAYNGAGNDISSISGQSNQQNTIHATDCTFVASNKTLQLQQVQVAAAVSVDICTKIASHVSAAHAGYEYPSSVSVFSASSNKMFASRSSALGYSSPTADTLFPIHANWHAHLGAVDYAGSSSSSKDIYASAIKRARWHYLQYHDSSLMTAVDAKAKLHYIVNQILRLDIWKDENSKSNHQQASVEVVVDDLYQGSSKPIEFSVLGRRVSSTMKHSVPPPKLSSLDMLEQEYRNNLYVELQAEFSRLSKEHRMSMRPKTLTSAPPAEKGHGKISTMASTFPTIDPNSAASALLNFHPYVVITSGEAYFENPTFRGKYHMFFGDFPEIAQYAYDDNYVLNALVAVPSYSAIFGHIDQDDLTITAITASIEIFDSNDYQNYSVAQVNLFNATLQLNRNVTVTRASFLTGSLITSVAEDTDSLIPYVAGGDKHPFVTFTDTLFTGVSLESILSAVSTIFDNTDDTNTNSTDQTLVTINSCTLVVEGMMISDSPSENHGSLNLVDFPTRLETNARILLSSGAVIHINPNGRLVLLTETYIDAESISSPAVINRGSVELLGRTKIANFTHTGRLDSAPFSKAASLGSLASRLIVHGDFVQTDSGSTTLYLNRTKQYSPAMYLINSANYSGAVYVDFYFSSENDFFPDLELYDVSQPSEFSLIAFRNRFSSEEPLAFDELTLHPQTAGLAFSQSTGVITTDIVTSGVKSDFSVASVNMYAWTLQVENIGCPQINEYYIGVPEQNKVQGSAPNAYPCFVCLQNTSCQLCNAAPGASAGQCAVAGSCGSAGVAFSSSCCSGGCNGDYGTCEVNADHTAFSCDCSKTIWYTGSNCKQLSAEAYVIIFSCVSFVITIALMGFFYHRSLQQKRIVLDELADGLLNHQTEGVNSEYIQYMQQALILNDVFVKWEEITLESIVGEGSFGVVHKATFRGAQVAVKQMRSMFTELTDKEIEEFRKEAYVMSRLRHPNIVLVMGISLVDQEPVALPKSRSQNMSADAYDSMNPGVADSKKAKPQQTVCIITEFLEQGSLADILYGPTKLPAEIWTYELVLTCALQAARGMLYLHSHQPPICHRDLKSSNLVVDDHWVVKVTDFGMSRIVPENVQDRDKGLLSPIASVSTSSSLGPRKFSLGNSPAGRKFSLGWPSQASSSLQTTPTIAKANAEAEANRKRKEEEAEAGERASIATVDSVQDSHPSMGEQSTGQDSQSMFSKAGKRAGANRLSTLNPEMTSNLGTTAWCAPEVLVSGMKTRYTVKVDVYSFGLVLWELWEKKRPFEELTSRFDIMDAVRAGKRPDISANCPPSFRSLIQRCWQHEPSRRPMFKYIVRYLKDELARVKRQKGGAMYNPSGMRPSGNNFDDDRPSTSRLTAFNIGFGADGDVEPRRSGSNYSSTAGGAIAEAAEAAAEFFRKSFSFRGSFAGTQQASSPTSNHRPWATGNRDDVYVHNDSAHNALAALSAAARRNEDGTLRMSDGTGSASGRASGAATTLTGTGTGTGSVGTGRASEVSGGVRQSESVPVKVPEGRSPLVTAVTSERSLSYLTESPAPFSQMHNINRQQGNRVPPAATQAPTPAPIAKNPSNNRWRDRYVMNFSGWAPTNPDSGLPPSMSTPSTPAGFGSGLPPTRSSVNSTPHSAFPAPGGNTSDDVSYNPLTRSSVKAAAGASSTSFNRANSNTSNPSSVASSPMRGGVLDCAISTSAASEGKEEDIFVLDEDEERKL